MKDQVAALTEAGVPAAFLNSSLSLEQLRETYAKTAKEQYKLLYVAPERLENESFLSLISHVPVSLLAVDEAHCISQWGQDFRPSYLKIADFIAQLPTRPVVAAFTATATKQVRADILFSTSRASTARTSILPCSTRRASWLQRCSLCASGTERPALSTATLELLLNACANF